MVLIRFLPATEGAIYLILGFVAWKGLFIGTGAASWHGKVDRAGQDGLYRR